MTTTPRPGRWLQGITGAALVAIGLSGLTGLWQGAANADPSDRRGSHEKMHQMMDAMHGGGAAARMHEVEGADEMMGQCASMMDAMDSSGMGGMMRDGMMERMMDGGNMSGTRGMMGSR